MPTWNGNEFLFADGTRPPIRTLTPLRHDATAPTSSTWRSFATARARCRIGSTGRRRAQVSPCPARAAAIVVDPHAPAFLIAGDESALPAITTLIPELPPAASVHVVVEVTDPIARLELPFHPRLTEQWCIATTGASSGDALHAALTSAAIEPDTRVWVAGEAAAMQRIRKHLFEVRSVPRDHAVVRGYWKG